MIEKLIEQNYQRRLKILCCGDSALDIYRYGKIERISPEYPLCILRSLNNEDFMFPAMSANVAYQFYHLNADIFLLCFTDNKLNSVLKNHKINTDYCVNLKNGFIPQKIRFYDNNFPLLRHDIEAKNYNENTETLIQLRNELIVKFNSIPNLDAVILSDYDKGLWDYNLAQYIINKCNEKNIITIIDPKRDISYWKNCTILKLNSKEALTLTGEKNWHNQADKLISELNCKSVVITCAGDGVCGKEKDYFEYRPKTISNNVNSTVGAGDAFGSILTTCLCHGIELVDACEIAFYAGMKYVEYRHNQPLTLQEIHSKIDKIQAKIITNLDMIKRNNLVFCNGVYDAGLTLGHIECLKFAKAQGDKLVVALNSDESVKRLKGNNRPILSLKDRIQIIASLEFVDYVVSFDEDTPLSLIEKLKPSLIVKGGDYQKENVVGYRIAEVRICPYSQSMSTSEKIKRLAL